MTILDGYFTGKVIDTIKIYQDEEDRGCLKLICTDGSELNLTAFGLFREDDESTQVEVDIKVVKESKFTSL